MTDQYLVLYSATMSERTRRKSNREIVLQSAADLFLTRGYQLTSMDDIVAQCGVSKTNIYYHFKSKEDLLLSVIDRFILDYQERIDGIVTRKDLTVREKLSQLMQVFLDDHTRKICLGGCPFLTLYLQVSQESAPVQTKVKSFFDHQTGLLEELLADAAGRGELHADTPVKPLAALLVSSIEGALFLSKATANPKLAEDVLHTLAYMLK